MLALFLGETGGSPISGGTSMPSPFPGMNPFLEQDDAWHDFHEKIIPAIAERLVAEVRPAYIVKIDEHFYELPPEPRLPVHDIERVAFVEIRDRRSRELVTVVEVLSPSNKQPGSSRDQYLAKRQELLNSRAHLVEINLLRGGKPMPLVDQPDRGYAYSVLVSRVDERPKAGLWPLGLRDRLPIVPVPLRAPDGDAQLDLQELLDRVYDASGYEDYIYSGLPDPPLAADDRAWAASLVPRGHP
jgi:hypothetical protein